MDRSVLHCPVPKSLHLIRVTVCLVAMLGFPPRGGASPSTDLLAKTAATRAVAVSAPFPPIVAPLAPLIVHAGETADQTISATDANGDSLTFGLYRGPSFVTVSTTDPGHGTASGNVHLAPSLGATGTYDVILSVSDSYYYFNLVQPFTVTVTPILRPIPLTIQVWEGSTVDQTIRAFDSEGHPLTFSLVTGPSFLTVTTTSDSTGNMHFAPGVQDAGLYESTVSVTDGLASVQAVVFIRVFDLNEGPLLPQPHDMHAVPGMLSVQTLSASDPNGNPVTFSKVEGPAYLSVYTLNAVTGLGQVWLLPSLADAGTAPATVAVTDGAISDQKSFMIQVDLFNNPPVLSPRTIEVAEGEDKEVEVAATDPDGHPLSVRISGSPPLDFPTFISWAPQTVRSDSALTKFRLLPSFNDAGTYRVLFALSDGSATVTDTLKIIVHSAYEGGTSLRLSFVQSGGVDADYEYAALDGRFRFSVGSEKWFDFRADNGSGANWHIAFSGPLTEGDHQGFLITGLDPTVPDLFPCVGAVTTYQIKQLSRRLDGTIGSFWMTFQSCTGISHFRGELRYHVASIPMTMDTPRFALFHANELNVIRFTASDSTGADINLSMAPLPTGATFRDSGDGHGALAWTPARGQAGDYLIRTIARSAGELADTSLTTIHVIFQNHTPRAFANGPYLGTVGFPLPFSSNGSSDPDGDALTYHWTFGDHNEADGPSPSNTYRAPGPYPVALVVSDGVLLAGDNTLATISLPSSARAIAVQGNGGLGTGRLNLLAGGGSLRVAMEISDSPAEILNLDRFSVRMKVKGWGSLEEIAADPTTFELGDADHNGVPDMTASFRREDLRRLFSGVRQAAHVDATVSLSLESGLGFEAPLSLQVVGPGAGVPVLVAPNPIRLAGMFSFLTAKEGTARLTLYDSHGRVARSLLESSSLPAGYHDVPIDARAGRGLSAGIYFYRLETIEGTRTGRIAILK